MDAATRRRVRARAAERCEYCRTRQEHDFYYRFHIEHIVPRQHGGGDDDSNLALACHHCNLHKGPNLTGIDPDSRRVVVLFNPRQQHWEEHFARRGPLIVGLTDIGRATAAVLSMNAPVRVELREELLTNGEAF